MHGAVYFGGAEYGGEILGLEPLILPSPIFGSAERIGEGQVTVGNLEKFLVFFATRQLTVAEQRHFFDPDRPSGQGLPLGVGFDPPEAFFELQSPGGDINCPPLIRIAEGEYGAIGEIPMAGKGVWSFRARGVEDGAPLVSSPPRAFAAVRAF